MANKVILIGRLTKDPTVNYTSTGKCVTQFTLAVNRTFKNQQGKYDADFIPVVVWDKTAELVGNSCAKGHRIYVEGRIQVRTYEDKDGTKKWVTEIIANSVEFIEKREQPKDMASMGTDVTKDAPFDEEVPF